jgi:hypothetical protein
MFIVEDAKNWALENSVNLDESRLGHKDPAVVLLNRLIPDKSKELWDAGCWLQKVLREYGVDENRINEIEMALGQRSFAANAWNVAVDYANEFANNGSIKEKGGIELAEKIHNEVFNSK